MTRSLLAAALVAALPAAVHAQGPGDAAILVAPHFASYDIGTGAAKYSISQTALPIVVTMPFTQRFSVDLTTAFASAKVTRGDTTSSSISGLTDTQIRANYAMAERNVVFTLGLNLPTGQYTIPEDQTEAAGQIGNDFLNFPISAMGNGLAGTGGVAYARELGAWNFGAGASFRKSTEFAAYDVSGTDLRFQPADEMRLSLGLDRPVRDGQVQFGLSYSAFGDDAADSTTYSTGDRLILSGSWSFPVKSTTVFLSGWNLYRMAGQQFAGDAPPENVANVSGGVSFQAGPALVQPNVEIRLWQVDGIKAGNLFNTGVRVRLSAGKFSFYPQVGYSAGNLYDISSGAGTAVKGLRSSLTVRWN